MGKLMSNKEWEKMKSGIQQEALNFGIIVTKKDCERLFLCSINNDFTPMYTTKLYQQQGAKYCRLLEAFNSWYNK